MFRDSDEARESVAVWGSTAGANKDQLPQIYDRDIFKTSEV
jgi:hypothetical protein